MMDEDEDVIIEGSPLYSHLIDAGFDDFEVTKSKNLTYVQENPNYKEFLKFDFFSCYSKLWQSFILSFLQIDGIDEYLCQSICEKLLKSKLLDEDDLSTLQGFSLIAEHVGDTKDADSLLSNQNKNNISSSSIIYFGLFWFSIVIGFISHLFACKEICVCTLFLCFIVAVSYTIRYCLLNWIASTLVNVDSFLIVAGQVKGKTFKCLKILKEDEVIFKNALKSPYVVQSESLYDALFSMYNSLFSFLDFFHDTLSTSNCLNGSQKALNSVYAFKFNKELGISEPQEGLTSAKSKRDVLFLQCSALLSELILFFESTNSFLEIYRICSLFHPSLQNPINLQLNYLENVLKIFETFYINDSYALKKSKSYEDVKDDLLIAVNSLSFHSKSSLSKVLNLLHRLDQDSLSIENSSESDKKFPSYEEALAYCQEIECEFQSCLGCLSDLKERFKRHYYKKDAEEPETNSLGISTYDDHLNELNPSFKTTPIAESDFSPVLDEVFEAYVEESTRDNPPDEVLSSWEFEKKKARQMHKKQQRQCKRVLMEIQPILHERRAMWEKREEEALKRQHTRHRNIPDCNDENTPSLFPDTKKACCASEQESLHTKFQTFSEDINKESEQYDSEEEQLRIYRKVKAELDADEAKRLKEELEASSSDSESEEADSPTMDLTLKNSENYAFLSLPRPPFFQSRVPPIESDIFEEYNSNQDTINAEVISSPIQELNCSLIINCNDESQCSSPFRICKDINVEETFSSGDDLSDAEDRIIDWDNCRPSKSISRNLEDRISSWGGNSGFSLKNVLAEGKERPSLFLNSSNNEVTFDGIGEAESESHSSRDSEDSS